MIAQSDPRWPLTFYSRIGGAIDLRSGDLVTAKCNFENEHEVDLNEHCYLFMMFYTSDKSTANVVCKAEEPTVSYLYSDEERCPYPGYGGAGSCAYKRKLADKSSKKKILTLFYFFFSLSQ